MLENNYKWANFITLCLIAFMMAFSVYSLYFGINPSDESLYVGVPYRFTMGDRPFVDEFNFQQTAGFFIFPFVKLYLYFIGSTKGILLFCRYLYFVSTIIVASIVFIASRKLIDTWTSALLAISCVVFVPWNIHALCYNTQVMLFLLVGYFFCLLSTRTNDSNPQRILSSHLTNVDVLNFCAGLSLASAVVCYLPILPLPIVTLLGLMYLLPRLRTFLAYGFGLIVGGSWYLIIIYQAGLDALLKNYHIIKSFGAQLKGGAIIGIIFKKYFSLFPTILGVLACIIVSLLFIALFISIKKTKISPVVIGIGILTALFIPCALMRPYPGCVIYLTSLGLIFSPIMFLLMKKENPILVKQLFVLIWIPAIIAGLIISWASSNSIINNVLGTFPAALAGIILLLTKTAPVLNKTNASLNKKSFVMSSIILVLFLGGIQYFNLRYFFENFPQSQFTYKLDNGPFKDIYTTKMSYDYYTQFTQDINKFSLTNKTILFFDNFPAGYLFSKLRPATNSIWLFSSGVFPTVDRQSTVDYLAKYHLQPDLIFKMSYIPEFGVATKFKENTIDPINNLLKNYKLVLHRSEYDIYQRV